MTPIVRIRNLGESGIEYEVKYWLEDYALQRHGRWYAKGSGTRFVAPV